MRFLATFLVLACACGAAPQRKVAVLGVERPGGNHDRVLEAWIVEQVDRGFDVVPKQTYAAEVDGIDAGELTSQQIRRVARRAGAEAVVYGALSKKKQGRATLTVRVHDGRTGKLIETHELAVKSGKVSGKQEQRFVRELLASLPPPPPPKEDAPVKRPPPPPPSRHDKVETPSEDTEVAIVDDEPEPRKARASAKRDDPPPAKHDDPPPPKARTYQPAESFERVKFTHDGQALDEEAPPLGKK